MTVETLATSTFTIQTYLGGGAWQDIPNCWYEWFSDALFGMRDMEESAGWREMRIVDGEGRVMVFGLAA